MNRQSGGGNIHTGQSATEVSGAPVADSGGFPQPKAAGRPRSLIHQAWGASAAANARPLQILGHAPVNHACQWG